MLIPFTRAWHTQRKIDLFMNDFINNRYTVDGKPRQPSPKDLKDFLNGLGTKDAIVIPNSIRICYDSECCTI